ncbi:hypothetical protein AAFC00_006631 [Neodothiora populina]|uniref:Zn(2)-C6 fungal-type domain-containing protein n=1 Tax=Neodothiora populina TaxID=2781224 RepID=A0ABR3PAL4_9PEZI
MKRLTRRSTPEGSSTAKRRRQDPVSCSSCRGRKLKCSREQPCSNCIARGFECDYGITKEARTEAWSLSPIANSGGGHPSSRRNVENEGSIHDQVLIDVLARLKRLESAVLDQDRSPGRSEDISLRVDGGRAQDRVPQGSRVQADTVTDQAFSSAENLTAFDNTMTVALGDNLVYNIRSISDIAAYADANKKPLGKGDDFERLILTRHLFLPPESAAFAFFDIQTASIGNLYHIYHTQSIQQLIREIYERLGNDQQVHPSHLGLLLAISATGAYFWNPGLPIADKIFQNQSEAMDACLVWIKLGLDVLDNNRRTTFPTIEDIQATIFLVQVLSNLEGFSPEVRFLHISTLNMARDMRLHVLDSPASRKRASSVEGYVMTEVKRRVWWYIVGNDWILANLIGPQDGCYLIQPEQTCVDLPLNINDTDLTDDRVPVGLPISQPTDMSYIIVRITLADLWRQFVNARPPVSSEAHLISESVVRQMDVLVDRMYDEQPPYYRLDMADDAEVKRQYERMPHLRMQCRIVNLGRHLAALRLHRPFLFRRPVSRSRQVCVDAARSILSIRRSMDDINTTLAHARTSVSFIVHHTFLAVLVLTFDLCFNDFPDDGTREKRKAEVQAACKTLQDTRDNSTVAARYLEPLLDTLKKHKVVFQDLQPQQQSQTLGSKDMLKMRQRSFATAAISPGTTMSQESIYTPGLNDKFATRSLTSTNGSTANDSTMPDCSAMNMTRGYEGSGATQWHDILDFPALEVTPDWDQLFADLDATLTY